MQGHRLAVPYQAPQGRRVNAIGVCFTHRPAAVRSVHQRWAVLPKSRAKSRPTTPEARAQTHGLPVDEVGSSDATRLVAFLWQLAGRPCAAPADWKRTWQLMIAQDNYVLRSSQTLQDAQPHLAADIQLVCLACYCPERSGIEPT